MKEIFTEKGHYLVNPPYRKIKKYLTFQEFFKIKLAIWKDAVFFREPYYVLKPNKGDVPTIIFH